MEKITTLLLTLFLTISAMAQGDFREKMKNVRWKIVSENVSIPSFMKAQDGYGSLFAYDNVMISNMLWGSWASLEDDFPSEGMELTSSVEGVFIKNITYKVERKGVYSGYTDDGRIFYLKTLPSPRWCGPPHIISYILIYPKEYQEAVTPIINKILHWTYSKEHLKRIEELEKSENCDDDME